MFTCDDVFIGGDWRPSAATGRLEVINPATGQGPEGLAQYLAYTSIYLPR